MAATLVYAIKFVGNMTEAVQFHLSALGLKLRFQSPVAAATGVVDPPRSLHGQRIAKYRDNEGVEFSVSGA